MEIHKFGVNVLIGTWNCSFASDKSWIWMWPFVCVWITFFLWSWLCVGIKSFEMKWSERKVTMGAAWTEFKKKTKLNCDWVLLFISPSPHAVLDWFRFGIQSMKGSAWAAGCMQRGQERSLATNAAWFTTVVKLNECVCLCVCCVCRHL